MAVRGSRWPSLTAPGGWRFAREALLGWRKAIEPLWVPGLAMVCLLIGHVVLVSPLLDLQGKDYDWGQYAVIGVVFPAFLFGVPLIWRWRGWSTAPAIAVKWMLAVTCLIVFAVFVVASMDKYGPAENQFWPVLALSTVQVLLMIRPWLRDGIDQKRVAILFIVAFVAWTATVSLFLYVYIAPKIFLTAFALAFLLVCWATWGPNDRRQASTFRLWSPANLAGLAFIVFMSFRTDKLFEVLGARGAIHHWGAWVAAADLVREGGWLLWDAPSNYGFLNVLAFNAVPTDTPWQSFYLLQALAYVVVSGGIFLVARSMRNGPLNWCLAMALAISIPMFTPTLDPTRPVSSTFIFPNAGPYRYLWAFVLVAILVWEYTTEERTRRQKQILFIGNAAWIVGVLWSTESAFFCSGAWLPAYVLIVLRMNAPIRTNLRSAAAWLALPVVMMATVIGAIMAYYAARLGHLPDWQAPLDYVQEVGLNVLVKKTAPIGPALGMLIGFCLLAIGALFAGIRKGLPTRSFALWVGLLGASWAANSYGFQRGSSMLHPVAYSAVVVMLVLVARRPRVQFWDTVVRVGSVPLLVLVLTSPFAAIINNPFAIQDVVSSLTSTARDGFKVEPLIPDADPTLQALIVSAGVRPDDPIVFFGDDLGNLLQPWTPAGETQEERVIANPHWLPAHQSLALRWIPDGRGEDYTSRWIERSPSSGWMIQRKTGSGSSADFNAYVGGREPWLFEMLHESHVPTQIHENADWQIVWWEYVGDQPGIERPISAFGYLGPLPPDVVVDGQPLAGTPHPEVWAQFGPGSGLYDPEKGGRPMGTGAIVWVYSPEPRSATLRWIATSGTQFHESVQLDEGWNQLAFTGESIVLARVEIDTLWRG